MTNHILSFQKRSLTSKYRNLFSISHSGILKIYFFDRNLPISMVLETLLRTAHIQSFETHFYVVTIIKSLDSCTQLR